MERKAIVNKQSSKYNAVLSKAALVSAFPWTFHG